MYSFLLDGAGSPVIAQTQEAGYQFFTYKGTKPFPLGTTSLVAGTKFGVKPSPDGRQCNLILSSNPRRVMTLNLAQATKLSKQV